ncbi:MAG: carboxymuconolactone decarboxylase family protein [Pseudomonadota bacterium]
MTQRLNGLTRHDIRELEPVLKVIEQTMGGFVPNSMFIMARNMELMEGFGMLSAAVFRGEASARPHPLKALFAGLRYRWRTRRNPSAKPISSDLRVLIFTAVSLSAGCRYCQAHSAMLSARRGVSPEKIDDILDYENSEFYSAAERAALALAFAAGRTPNETTAQHFSSLKEHYSDEQIIDIVAAIAYMGFLNRWNDTFATLLEDQPLRFASDELKKVPWEVGKHSQQEQGQQEAAEKSS